jgi:hypothetical protein
MIGLRKKILLDRGVLRDAAVRSRGKSPHAVSIGAATSRR